MLRVSDERNPAQRPLARPLSRSQRGRGREHPAAGRRPPFARGRDPEASSLRRAPDERAGRPAARRLPSPVPAALRTRARRRARYRGPPRDHAAGPDRHEDARLLPDEGALGAERRSHASLTAHGRPRGVLLGARATRRGRRGRAAARPHERDPTRDRAPRRVSRPGRSRRAAGRVAEGTPYLLVLGNAYVHKNRLFALRLFARLARDHGWDGTLVLAGGHPPFGASVEDEQAYLAGQLELRPRVVDLGAVGEDEKRWLLRNAKLLLYPSLYEGFGLVPFEAAALGTPAVYAHRSSMQEFLPLDGALFKGWASRTSPCRWRTCSVTQTARRVSSARCGKPRSRVHGSQRSAPPRHTRASTVCPVGGRRCVPRRRRPLHDRATLGGGGRALDELRLLKAHRGSTAISRKGALRRFRLGAPAPPAYTGREAG